MTCDRAPPTRSPLSATKLYRHALRRSDGCRGWSRGLPSLRRSTSGRRGRARTRFPPSASRPRSCRRGTTASTCAAVSRCLPTAPGWRSPPVGRESRARCGSAICRAPRRASSRVRKARSRPSGHRAVATSLSIPRTTSRRSTSKPDSSRRWPRLRTSAVGRGAPTEASCSRAAGAGACRRSRHRGPTASRSSARTGRARTRSSGRSSCPTASTSST